MVVHMNFVGIINLISCFDENLRKINLCEFAKYPQIHIWFQNSKCKFLFSFESSLAVTLAAPLDI